MESKKTSACLFLTSLYLHLVQTHPVQIHLHSTHWGDTVLGQCHTSPHIFTYIWRRQIHPAQRFWGSSHKTECPQGLTSQTYCNWNLCLTQRTRYFKKSDDYFDLDSTWHNHNFLYITSYKQILHSAKSSRGVFNWISAEIKISKPVWYHWYTMASWFN